MCNKDACTQGEAPCDTCQRFYGNKSAKPHKWAKVIKAWADGEHVEFCEDGKWESFPDFLYTEKQEPVSRHLGFLGLGATDYKWRVKPVHPTLGEIARKAWYEAYRSNRPEISVWAFAADAVAAAVASGEYSR